MFVIRSFAHSLRLSHTRIRHSTNNSQKTTWLSRVASGRRKHIVIILETAWLFSSSGGSVQQNQRASFGEFVPLVPDVYVFLSSRTYNRRRWDRKHSGSKQLPLFSQRRKCVHENAIFVQGCSLKVLVQGCENCNTNTNVRCKINLSLETKLVGFWMRLCV